MVAVVDTAALREGTEAETTMLYENLSNLGERSLENLPPSGKSGRWSADHSHKRPSEPLALQYPSEGLIAFDDPEACREVNKQIRTIIHDFVVQAS